MIDMENVIKALEICVGEDDFSVCVEEECPYIGGSKNGNCITNLERDALALLKEQEAVVPILIREGRNKNYNDYVCPRCDNEVVYEQNYCSECGVKFMWEGR